SMCLIGKRENCSENVKLAESDINSTTESKIYYTIVWFMQHMEVQGARLGIYMSLGPPQ
ncbi:hypothetical protein ACJX0J_031436, partial [Zea mays]